MEPLLIPGFDHHAVRRSRSFPWPTDDLHDPLARYRNRCSRGPEAVLEKWSAIAAAIS
jgi:hypothetical protein